MAPERAGRVRKGRKAKTPKSTIAVVRLAPFKGVLSPKPLDAASLISRHLAVEVGRLLQGHGRIPTPSTGLILVAESTESDQQEWFCLDDVDGLLERFSESPSTLGESGMHLGTASLFPWEELGPSEWAERRRRELTSGLSPARVPEMGQGAQQKPKQGKETDKQGAAGEVPDLNVSGPPVERTRALSPEERRVVIEEEAKANPDGLLRFVYELASPEAQSRLLKAQLGTLRTTEQAADELGLSHVWLKKLAQQGELGTKVGRNYLLTPFDITSYKKKDRKPGPKTRKDHS